MRKLLIVKCAILSFIAIASALSANEDHAAEYIVQRAYTSIARIEEGKIFLKPEKLSLKQGVIYLEDINGTEFAIPVVFSPEGRPYTQSGESIIFNTWTCSCGALNHKWDNPRYCWRCGEPR
ncbi:MAG: hypothetical protein KGJ02_06845 [Verrucomicrobiota bacterium]|nr:hypothetical protein [Verrucomicrobiota bacterium]